MFCFKNKAKNRVVKEPGEAVLIKWRNIRVKGASWIDNKGFVDVK